MKAALAVTALAVSACAFAGAATASTLSDAQQRYRQERAVCMGGTSNQDRATCLREAGAALAEAKQGGLATRGDRDLGSNRTARCAALPQQDREACTLRMQDGTASGSAQQGGILREVTTTTPSR